MRTLALLAMLAVEGPPAGLSVEANAVKQELARGLDGLRLESAPRPYYAELRIVRAELLGLAASYGGIVTNVRERQCTATVEIRIGTPERDNTGFFGADGGLIRFDVALDPAPELTRKQVWLAMDGAFRGAAKAYAQKQTVLDRLAVTSDPPDWGPGPERIEHLMGAAAIPAKLDVDSLRVFVKALSARFGDWPSIDNGDVHLQVLRTHEVLITSEGVMLDWINERSVLAALADTQLEDGMRLDHGLALHFQAAPVADEKLAEAGAKLVDRVLTELEALARAPMLEEDYDGPILFVGSAAAQFLASTVPTMAAGDPPPLGESGRLLELEPAWQNKVGKSVFPPFVDLVDDPGEAGFGSYAYDAQGFRPLPLRLVEGGELKSLLMTRTPNRALRRSNGRARATPALGIGPSISNLTLSSRRRGLTSAAMERELLRRAREDGYEFAYVVEWLRDGAILGPLPRDTAMGYGGAGKIDFPVPARIYRIEPGGRRTQVRGAVLAAASPRVLRRIRAVGRDPTSVPLRLAPGFSGGYAIDLGIEGVLGHTVDVEVVTPDLLIDGLELLVERGEHERPPTLVHPLRRGGSLP